MRNAVVALGLTLTALAGAQQVQRIYDRDTQGAFQLKGLKVYSTVMGPIVRTSAQYTYDNPAKKLTEASIWFSLPQAAALSGFGYFYRNEYVPGVLMDQNKAWFIYTAITSRNEDPGIMVQKTPSSFHAQIFPLAQGYDLRVHLYSVGFLVPGEGGVALPKPSSPGEAPVEWQYREAGSKALTKIDSDFKLPVSDKPVVAVAQRFKDGKVYVAGTVTTENAHKAPLTFAVLRNPQTMPLSEKTLAFAGWLPANRKIALRADGVRYAFKPQTIGKGPEAAQLWAQQMLANRQVPTRDEVLRFSMKYHIPSYATALLAVPEEQMKLYRAKAAEYRKQELASKRRERQWQRQRQQNWSRSGGGDPEIRVEFPNAKHVVAVLPDGQVIELQRSYGFWGGNFEIPASAKEGGYDVRVVAFDADGARTEKTLHYVVDRTAPDGKVTVALVDAKVVVEVRSEPKLDEVAAYTRDGVRTKFEEVEPGLYRATFDNVPLDLTIVLKDGASNKREIKCSWPPSR